MSFWTGFGTGLAKSVDQGLQKAMSKRDDELSRAKTFWQTRQAQKLDQKEAYDARAEKSLRRLIRETGSSTLGLAAFNAAGGDADGAEDFLKNVDATRNAGETYNIRENLNLPKDYKAGDDIDESAALKSVRMTLKGVDESMIGIDDSMARIGLGLKGGAVKRVADSVNSLIEPEIVETLNNIPNVTIDRSGFVSAIDRDREILNNTPGLEKQLDINTQKFLKLDKTDAGYEDAVLNIEKENSIIYLALSKRASAKDTTQSTGLDFPKLLRLKTDSRTGVDDDIGWTPGSGGSAPSVSNGPNGTELSGPDAVAYRNQKQDSAYDILAKSNLLDSDGEFLSKDAEAIASGSPALIDAVKRTRAAIAASKKDGTGTAADATKVEIPFDKQKIAVQSNPMGALTKFMKVNGAKATPDAMLNLLRKYEYSDDEAIGLIQEVMKQNQPAPNKPSFADLTKKKVGQNAPIALNKLTPGTKAHGDWIATYGKTHNPDGTPK